jgi:hypothetical protein
MKILAPLLKIVLLFTLFTTACVKEESDYEYVLTEIEGQLMNRGTREILNDKPYRVELIISYTFSGFDEEPTQTHEKLETFTDENGYYKLYHLSRRNMRHAPPRAEHKYGLTLPDGLTLDGTYRGTSKYEIGPSRDGNTNVYTSHEVLSGYKGTFNLLLNQKAWLRLHVENVNPQPGDRIGLEFPFGYSQVIEGPANFEVLLDGVANTNNALNFWLTRNGVAMFVQRDSIMLGFMDTTYYKFEY